MTKEEILEILEKEKAYMLSHGGDRQAMALDEAIKAVKQKSVLDKIRAEIEDEYGQYTICEYFEDYDYDENDISEYIPIGTVNDDILEIFDKYKKEIKK